MTQSHTTKQSDGGAIFARAAELVDAYIGLMKESAGFNRHAAGELLDLVKRLDLILEMIRDHEAAFREQLAASGGLLTDATNTAVEKMKIITDTFYQSAGRIRILLKDPRLPHLGVS